MNAVRRRLRDLERRAFTRMRWLADRRQARRAIRSGSNPRPAHLITGERGEDAAFFYLRSLGYTIVGRRWRTARLRGDLDLVAWDGDTLVIFEVKTRTARDLAPAESEVDDHKRQVLRRMAAAYVGHLPEMHRASVRLRFDVLSVYLKDGSATAEPDFEHFRNAFPAKAPPRPWRR